MRAVVRDAYGGPEMLRIEEVPDPSPGPGEAVVRIRASSLNMADVDLLFGRPWPVRLVWGVRAPKSPHLGIDIAGEVEDVGAGVRGFQPGDHVWADIFGHGQAAFAERVRVPVDVLRRIPVGVSFADAATVPHSGLLAMQLLRSIGGVRAGERVLVNGGGGCVGPFAIQLAAAAGSHVTGVDTAGKSGLMRRAGAADTIDFETDDVTRSGRRFDVVVDIADTRGIISMRRLLVRGGRHTMVARRLGSYAVMSALGPAIGAATGVRMGSFVWGANDGAMLHEYGRLLASGTIRPIVDGTRTLDDVPDALARLIEGEARGKIVIEP